MDLLNRSFIILEYMKAVYQSNIFLGFVVVCLLIVSTTSKAQSNLPPSISQMFKPQIMLQDSMHLKPFTFTAFSFNSFDPDKLPLFCRTEHKWSKKSGINVRMRLGSLAYVDKLENK